MTVGEATANDRRDEPHGRARRPAVPRSGRGPGRGARLLRSPAPREGRHPLAQAGGLPGNPRTRGCPAPSGTSDPREHGEDAPHRRSGDCRGKLPREAFLVRGRVRDDVLRHPRPAPRTASPIEPNHGHDWRVEAVAAGETLDALGVVVDFEHLKEAVGEVGAPLPLRRHHDPPRLRRAEPVGRGGGALLLRRGAQGDGRGGRAPPARARLGGPRLQRTYALESDERVRGGRE